MRSTKLDTILRTAAEVEQRLGHNRFILAGGFVRDTLLDRPVKDIDVVVESTNDFDTTWEHLTDDDERYSRGVRALASPAFDLDGTPVELMVRKHEFAVSDVFDYHILTLSNAAVYNGRLWVTTGFMESIATRTLLCTLDTLDAMDTKYLDRVSEKYKWPIKYGYSDKEHTLCT